MNKQKKKKKTHKWSSTANHLYPWQNLATLKVPPEKFHGNLIMVG